MTIMFSFILTLIETIAFSFIADTVLKRKNKPYFKLLIFLLIATTAALATGMCIPNLSPLGRSAFAVIVFFVISLNFYQGAKLYKLLLCIIFFTMLAITDYLIMYITMSLFSLSYETLYRSANLYYLISVLSKLILFLFSFFNKKFIKQSKTDEKQTTPILWLLLIVPFFSIINMVIIIDTAIKQNDGSFWTFIVAFGLLLSNIVMTFLWDKLEKDNELQLKSKFLEQEIKNTMNKTLALESLYTSQRRNVHDFKNQINVLQGLLDLNETVRAKNYIHLLTKKINESEHTISANHLLIDVVLNQKYAHAQQKGIVMSFVVNDLQNLQIKDADIITLLTNVLDNAIEACEKCENEKEVNVKILIREDKSLLISVVNTSLYTQIIENNIETSKPSKIEHGFGLQNIKQIVRVYSGELLLKYSDGLFQLTIVIP